MRAGVWRVACGAAGCVVPQRTHRGVTDCAIVSLDGGGARGGSAAAASVALAGAPAGGSRRTAYGYKRGGRPEGCALQPRSSHAHLPIR